VAAEATLGVWASRLKVVPPGGQAAVFFVFGNAVPQPRPRVSVRCGFGHAYVPAKHPIHAWRASVEAACRRAIRRTISGPVAVCIDIRISRPPSHWTTKGLLSAAGRRATEPGGDWDNLAKAIQDAIVDAAGIEDDRQACGPNVVCKRWAVPGEESGALVWVSPAELVWCVWGSKVSAVLAAGATA
jgi:Holliday junction resolvase RusA-like endonuclease